MDFLKPKFTKEVISGSQTAGNIADQLKRAIYESKEAAGSIAKKFKGSNDQMSCFNVWNYCRNHINYRKETANLQTAKTLQRILHDKQGDCKHYTTFCCSVLRALGIRTQMRLISQNFYDSDPNHIYCVAIVNGEEIIVDPCIKVFNSEAAYKYKYNLNLKKQ
jgi:hypothetical protein